MKNLNLKKNQVVIFVIALMLVTAGYLNFSNQQNWFNRKTKVIKFDENL